MLTEEEIEEINGIIKREGYLNFIKEVQGFLINKKNYYSECCSQFNVNNENKQENNQRKTYVIRKATAEKVEDKTVNNETVAPVEENIKLLNVPVVGNKTSSNILEILKSKSVNKIINVENDKKYSEEEIKKIRKGRAIQKFYKNK
jgi:hypothetical protein